MQLVLGLHQKKNYIYCSLCRCSNNARDQPCGISLMSHSFCIDFNLKPRVWKLLNGFAEYWWHSLSCTFFTSYARPFVTHTDLLAWSVWSSPFLPLPLTLCVRAAPPFLSLIRSTNVPCPPTSTPFAHTTLPSALITEPFNWSVWSNSEWSPPHPTPPSFTAIYEKSAGETEAIAFDGRTFIEYHNAVTKR